MSSTPIRIGADSTNSEFVLRAGVAFLAVLACYLFDWHWLRSATLQANSTVDALLGVRLQRIAPDTVLWNGTAYRYVISCTMADVWCGALAFLIDVRRGFVSNIRSLVIFTLGLFAFNALRLSISDVLQAHSVPWVLAHEAFAGVCYYLIWLYLWHTRTWK